MREQHEGNIGGTASGTPPEGGPGVDARDARGLQVNQGSGNSQVNNFGQPSLKDDLRNLNVRDIESAFDEFCKRDRGRQLWLLSEYPRSDELLNLICTRAGYEQCADLLYGMAADRLMQRLGQLQQEHRTEVLKQLATRLAADTEGAPARVREYAAASRGRTAQMLVYMSRLHTGPERGRTTTTVRLLPGPGFILELRDDAATILLKSLLFRYGPAAPDGGRQLIASPTQEAPRLLEQLVTLDAERVTAILIPLDAAMIAACLRHIRMTFARRILHKVSADYTDRYEEILEKLPRPMAAALLGQMSPTARSRAGALDGWTTGWLWIDACLTLLTYAAPILTRLADRGGRRLPATEVRHEVHEIWRAATSHAVKDGDYYRKQRNQLALSTVVLLLSLVVAIALH
ncbi:hypothetical protein SAMN05421833_104285 [Microbispora rosea]|uniref:Uncharacterized protein n=2 Tax=Microbispora rosea TaxID=58117 RepID=A0A1N6WNN6_9ACTN|nr:hypothetical protein Mro03_41750 [Microbispora rosea subsp. rosea]SIQ91638.1 hypothetical protein SAMN05421833_104285 [Microbispora rosea]